MSEQTVSIPTRGVRWIKLSCYITWGLLGWVVGDLTPRVKLNKRIEALERIVGTETPASMTWTNGHTYTTLVKHSANCPCVK